MNRVAGESPDTGEVNAPETLFPVWRTRVVDLGRMEMAIVRSQARLGRIAVLRPFALLLNHLGNGWLYVVLAAVLLWLYPGEFLTIALTAGLAVGLAHTIYPWLKRLVARPRPFEVDPNLLPLLKAMDRYAFPSGHCMTAAAVAIPLSVAHPVFAGPAIISCVAIAWARLVAAHHYPSDIVAGFALGAVAALAMTTVFH